MDQATLGCTLLREDNSRAISQIKSPVRVVLGSFQGDELAIEADGDGHLIAGCGCHRGRALIQRGRYELTRLRNGLASLLGRDGRGGLVGLCRNPFSVRLWMVRAKARRSAGATCCYPQSTAIEVVVDWARGGWRLSRS